MQVWLDTQLKKNSWLDNSSSAAYCPFIRQESVLLISGLQLGERFLGCAALDVRFETPACIESYAGMVRSGDADCEAIGGFNEYVFLTPTRFKSLRILYP